MSVNVDISLPGNLEVYHVSARPWLIRVEVDNLVLREAEITH